jgi:hypothetical protein
MRAAALPGARTMRAVSFPGARTMRAAPLLLLLLA